jgi:hypothetical protein
MQDFDYAGSDAIVRTRAEIKSRLLRSVSLTERPTPVRQQPAAPGPQAFSESEIPDPHAEACDDEATAGHSGEVKWIEPVFVDAIPADRSAEEDHPSHTVDDDAARPHSVPAQKAADEMSHLEAARAPSAPPRPVRFWWGRRSTGSPELAPGVATYSRESAAQREASVDEVAALRRGLAAERAAAAEEIATLRKTLAAEREAAADEIATLRTILASQREAAIARKTRIKVVLGASDPGSDRTSLGNSLDQRRCSESRITKASTL